MVETGFHPVPQSERSHMDSMIHTLQNGVHLTRIRPGLLGIFAIGLFFGLYSEGVDRLWEARMVAGFNFPLFEPVIWFGLIHIAGMLLGSLCLGLLQKWKYATDLNQSIWLQSFLSVGIMAGLFIFAATGNFYMAAVMIFLITIFREVHYPLYTGWVNRKLDSSVRATVLSMASLVDASGQIGGGPLVGAIATRMGIPFGLTISALLLTPVLPFYAFLYRRLNGNSKSDQG
jgi:DHA3 family tetracycline resistance protein-like MFS transporter